MFECRAEPMADGPINESLFEEELSDSDGEDEPTTGQAHSANVAGAVPPISRTCAARCPPHLPPAASFHTLVTAHHTCPPLPPFTPLSLAAWLLLG
eukprot:COSAG06_NODE_5737_length_3300_cov_6.881287_4_plen_96_part_00